MTDAIQAGDFVFVGVIDSIQYYYHISAQHLLLRTGKRGRLSPNQLQCHWYVVAVNSEMIMCAATRAIKYESARIIYHMQCHGLVHAERSTFAELASVFKENDICADLIDCIEYYYKGVINMQPWARYPTVRLISDLVINIIDMRNMKIGRKTVSESIQNTQIDGVYENGRPVNITYQLRLGCNDSDWSKVLYVSSDRWSRTEISQFIRICIALKYHELCNARG